VILYDASATISSKEKILLFCESIGNKNILVGAKCKVVEKGKWNKILTMY
jgi:hypothetical protein